MKFKLSIMKKLISITILFPIFSFAQTYYDSALNFQNAIRSYYDLIPLNYDSELSLKAQEWADYLAETDQFEVSDDPFGENIFAISTEYIFSKGKQPCLEASMNWILESDDNSTLHQIIYEDAKRVGFGVAENHEYIYVVAKYDQLYK